MARHVGSMWLVLSLFVACGQPVCAVDVSDVHTVLRADIQTPAPERVRVVWEAEGREGSTPLDAEATTSHAHFLLDLAPLVDVAWRVLDADEHEICAGDAATQNLSPGTPDFGAVASTDDVPPYWLVTLSGIQASELQSRVGLLRSDGTWIWSYDHPTPDEHIISADLTDDGIRFNRFDAMRLQDIATIDTLAMDGSTFATARTPLAHHFFVGLDAGAVAYLRADARVAEGFGCVVGDTLVERAADGTERDVWSAWDTLPLAPSEVWDEGFYPGCKDWTHGSGLSWRASDQTFLVSLMGVKQIAHVHRETGATLETFGPRAMTPPAAGSPAFQIPHNATWSAAGDLLVFDSRDVPIEESGCYRYTIDRATGTIVNDRRWVDSGHLGLYLGGVSELPDGQILCTWSSDGFARLFQPDASIPGYELRVNGLFQFGTVRPYEGLPGLE